MVDLRVVGLASFVFSVRGLLRKAVWTGVLVLAAICLYRVNTHALFYLGIWLFGGALALAHQRAGGWLVRPWGLISGLFTVITLVGTVAPSLILAGGSLFGWLENVVQFVICAFWCALILPDQRSGMTAAWWGLFHLGECSFSLYILHFPLMLFLLSVMQSTLGTAMPLALGGAVVSVVVSLTVAHLSARLFEDKKRFLALLWAADAKMTPRLGQGSRR